MHLEREGYDPTINVSKSQEELIVSAGGKSSRLREFLNSKREGMPKHLLELPGDHGYLLGAIVECAGLYFYSIRISVSDDNFTHISDSFEHNNDVVVEVDDIKSGPLGPLIRSALSSNEKAYGCAGDFYCDFSWKEFDAFHDSHDLPISILVAKSRPTNDGARFDLQENGVIKSWERVQRTNEHDLINIGAYIIEPDSRIQAGLEAMTYHKEDVFNDLFIPAGLVAGYNPGKTGFNVNTVEIYEQLWEYLIEGN